MPLSNNAKGALWLLASVVGATGMTLSVRLLSADLHTVMLVFLRSAFGLLLVLPVFWRVKVSGRPLRFSAWRLHLLRGAFVTVALNGGFYAIWHLPMAQATILFFMAPVFATLISMAVRDESVGPRRWAAIGAGFLGAMIILRPGVGTLEPAMLSAIVSSVCFAASLILGRLISERDSVDSTFVSTNVIVAFTTLPPALFFWELPPDLVAWALLGVLVLCSSARTYSDIQAYTAGEAGFLAPFSYLRLVTIGLAGYVGFNEVPDAATVIGGTVIVSATLYISFREHRLGRRRPRPSGAP